MKSNLINIDDKVDFSTFEISIREVDKLTTQNTVETKFGTKIKNSFNDSIYIFKNTMESLILFLVYILPPYGIIIGIIIYFVIKFRKRKIPPPKE